MKEYVFLTLTYLILFAFSLQSAHYLQNVRIAVVGAGAAGLAAIHHLKKEVPSAEIIAFDLNGEVGGTWLYTDKVGKDEYGAPIRSSMYKNLRANLPKKLMSYSDFSVPSHYKNFMDRTEVLTYLKSYAKVFDIYKHIKFRHTVTSIKFLDEKWIVTYENNISKNESTEIFDYVIVANGHFSEPAIPHYEGLNIFKGSQIHSHDYRTPERYTNRTVLFIGAGPSGTEISIEVADFSKKVILSHHYFRWNFKLIHPSHYIQKPDVIKFTENSAIFKDGTEEKIDDIIFSTGYGYYGPFLDNSTGIKIERAFVSPLYRDIVNVNHPSMLFIGVPQFGCTIPVVDIQARYIAALFKGKFKLPSQKKMLEEMDRDYNGKNKIYYTVPRVATHTLGTHESVYYAELADEANILSIPPVFCAIRYSTMDTKENLYTYRNYNYKIIDDEHFIRTYGEGTDEERSKVFDSRRCEVPLKSNVRKNINVLTEDSGTVLNFIKAQNDSLSFENISIY